MKKKIFIILSAVVTMLFCIVPVAAHADSSEDPNYGTYSEFRSGYNLSSNSSEFICKYHIINSSNQTFYFTSGFSIPKDQFSEYIDTAVMNGSIFDLRLKKPVYFFVGYRDFQFNVNQNWSISVLSLSFDTSSNILNLYDENNNLITKDFFTGEQFSPIVIDDYTTNFEEFHSANSIYASIFPELKENFDYTAEFEGDNLPLNILQVDIHNDTTKPYQYAILIQPKGEALTIETPLDNSTLTDTKNFSIFWSNSKVTYALMKDEWFYDFFANTGAELLNGPCAWHFVSAGEMKREHLYYEQMMLKANTDYTFKVLAVDLSSLGVSDHPRTGVLPGDIQTIYSKDFSVKTDTVFNPNSVSNGAYSFNPNESLNSQFDKVKGYFDKNSNEVKITENSNFSDFYNRVSGSGSSGSSSSSYSVSGSSSSFNDLLLYSSSYLSLCKSVLSYFPPWVIVLLTAGLIGLIVVAIWKKV